MYMEEPGKGISCLHFHVHPRKHLRMKSHWKWKKLRKYLTQIAWVLMSQSLFCHSCKWVFQRSWREKTHSMLFPPILRMTRWLHLAQERMYQVIKVLFSLLKISCLFQKAQFLQILSISLSLYIKQHFHAFNFIEWSFTEVKEWALNTFRDTNIANNFEDEEIDGNICRSQPYRPLEPWRSWD